jgi:hypothetical protein
VTSSTGKHLASYPCTAAGARALADHLHDDHGKSLYTSPNGAASTPGPDTPPLPSASDSRLPAPRGRWPPGMRATSRFHDE